MLGLLLRNGGTVCDDLFDYYSAEAICRVMGYNGQTSWTSRYSWSIQSTYDIKLDNVDCNNFDWDDCSFSTSHNCGHSEDVFLECYRFGENVIYSSKL